MGSDVTLDLLSQFGNGGKDAAVKRSALRYAQAAFVGSAIETRFAVLPGLIAKADRARHVVLGLVDMILFCDSVARTAEDGSIVIDRVIRTKPHPTYEAGDRTGRLPATLPLGR